MLKKIEDFPDYFVSDSGHIYSNKSGSLKEICVRPSFGGYLYARFSQNGKFTKSVHRIVAKAFVPNPDMKPQVNHKNGINTDNRACNLEWVTQAENNLHKYRVLGRKNPIFGLYGRNNPKAKAVFQLKDGIVVAEYPCLKEASKITNIHYGDMSRCCNGFLKSAGGYQWKYKE